MAEDKNRQPDKDRPVEKGRRDHVDYGEKRREPPVVVDTLRPPPPPAPPKKEK